MLDALVEAVPIGEDNAVPARTIWRSLDCWAVRSVTERLNRLALAGTIQRRKLPRGGGERWVYWRDGG
jgi:predicted transcriptional regulator